MWPQSADLGNRRLLTAQANHGCSLYEPKIFINRFCRMAAFALLCLLPSMSFASEINGSALSIAWGIPFAGLLLSIALLPLVMPGFWHRHLISPVIAMLKVGADEPFGAVVSSVTQLDGTPTTRSCTFGRPACWVPFLTVHRPIWCFQHCWRRPQGVDDDLCADFGDHFG